MTSPTFKMWSNRFRRVLVRKKRRSFSFTDFLSDHFGEVMFSAVILLMASIAVGAVFDNMPLTKAQFTESSDCAKAELLKKLNNNHKLVRSDLRFANSACETIDTIEQQKKEFK